MLWTIVDEFFFFLTEILASNNHSFWKSTYTWIQILGIFLDLKLRVELDPIATSCRAVKNECISGLLLCNNLRAIPLRMSFSEGGRKKKAEPSERLYRDEAIWICIYCVRRRLRGWLRMNGWRQKWWCSKVIAPRISEGECFRPGLWLFGKFWFLRTCIKVSQLDCLCIKEEIFRILIYNSVFCICY